MNHEHTRVYAAALELVSLCNTINAKLPPGLGFLADQMRRASASVALNLAEGCKKPSRKERARYLDIAVSSEAVALVGVLAMLARSRGRASRRSLPRAPLEAHERSPATLDVAACFKGIDKDVQAVGKDKCDHICAMLHRFK